MTLARFLPPVLVLAIVIGVVGTAISRPSRDRAQRAVDLLVADRFRRPEAAEALRAYHARYGAEQDRWFTIERMLQVRFIEEAVGVLREDGPPNSTDLRRFGSLGLRTLGWEEPQRTTATGMQFQTLPILAEGGDEVVRKELRAAAEDEEMLATAMFLLQGMRTAGHDGIVPIIEGYRSRTGSAERSPRAAAAFATFGRDDLVPGIEKRPEDMDLLLSMLARERIAHRDAWAASAFALGRSREARALEALRSLATRLGESSVPQARRDLDIVRVALAAGGQGDADLLASLGERAAAEDADGDFVQWYSELALLLVLRKDPRAEAVFDLSWRRLAMQHPEVMIRAVQRLALSAEAPAADDPRVAGLLARLRTDLEGRPNDPVATALLFGLDLRADRPGTRENLLTWLEPFVHKMVTTASTERGRYGAAWIQALRTLFLYG